MTSDRGKLFLVTVKLPKNPAHNPRDKRTGPCPVNVTEVCTDTTGEHHTIVVHGSDVEDVSTFVRERFAHITRLESCRPLVYAVQRDIAYSIRAELVCCHIFDEVIEVRDTLSSEEFTARISGHEICYWGEAAAKLAEEYDG